MHEYSQKRRERQAKISTTRRSMMLFVLGSGSLIGGPDNNAQGTKPIALGDAFVAVADNVWATLYNPSGLTTLRSWEISIFVNPAQFGLSELRTNSIAAAIPMRQSAVGIVVDQFGFDLYKETTVRVGYGYLLEEDLSLGITMNLGRIAFDRYGVVSTKTFNVGLLTALAEDVTIGALVSNVFSETVGAVRERLPQVLRLGMRWSVSSDFLLTGEIEKDVLFPLIMKGGLQLRLFEGGVLRLGGSSNPDKFSVGFMVGYSHIEFGYAGYDHRDLGWSHQFEIGFLAK